jgi:tetratricopeptide (TPR) repeat protein
MDIEKRAIELKSTLNSDGESTDKTFEVLERHLNESPNDERLWDARGDYIQRYGGNDEKLSFEEAKLSYLRAIECNEKYARAYESLGYFYDVVEDDYKVAEKYFRKSISIEATVDSYKGLARVIAQQNRTHDAIQVLSEDQCPFSDDIDILILKDEIQDGYWESDV